MDLKAGDIAACYGTDRPARLIQWETVSLLAPPGLRLGPSHVAIIAATKALARGNRSQLVWCESTTLCDHPCLFRGRPVSGIQAHWPEQRIADYVDAGGRVAIYRLRPFDILLPSESRYLMQQLHGLLHQRIDYDYRGAAISGTRLYKWLGHLAADEQTLFCSELIAALLQRLGRMNRSNPTRFNPASLLRELVRTGVYALHATHTADTPLTLSLKLFQPSDQPCDTAA